MELCSPTAITQSQRCGSNTRYVSPSMVRGPNKQIQNQGDGFYAIVSPGQDTSDSSNQVPFKTQSLPQGKGKEKATTGKIKP